MDVVREGSETAIYHTRDGRYGAQVTRFEDGRVDARRWAVGDAGRIDEFLARTRTDGVIASDPESALSWMVASAFDTLPPDLAHTRIFDPRAPALAPSAPRECRPVEETHSWGEGCSVTTVRECDVVHLQFGRCDGNSWRTERTVTRNGTVTVRDETASVAQTHRDDAGRIVWVRGVFRRFNPESYRMTVNVTYDTSGRLVREHSVADVRSDSTTRTLTREYDDAGQIVRSEVAVAYEGTDEREGFQDVVQYRYGACDYAITGLTPEPRHVAFTESNVDWVADDYLIIP